MKTNLTTTRMNKPTRLSLFISKWSSCTRCRLCSSRLNVVLCKGRIPCDILFVGEGPGVSEDSMGIPFCGPAGLLQDDIIAEAGLGSYRKAFCNVVCCMPKNEDGTKAAQPTMEEILACKPRLVEFIRICKPKVIVAVGEIAQNNIPTVNELDIDWFADDRSIEVVKMLHPAAILKGPIQLKELKIQQTAVTLRDDIQSLTNRGVL